MTTKKELDRASEDMAGRMSHWNHRVFEHDDGHGGKYYQVHEVYYDQDGNPMAHTKDGTTPMGETLEELSEDLALYVAALTKPVLCESELDYAHEPA